jgi:glycine dehydrogenase subunit 1
MPFIPHTEYDLQTMLAAIGAQEMADLFREIPASLMVDSLPGIPHGLTEMQVSRLMDERAATVAALQCFIGAGAYEHHIPSAVWDVTLRGENLTGYTPYQAEANQGTLQLLWEYQTMMASLMALEVSNASLYDGATSLAEALLMACRIQKKDPFHCIWIPQTIHPFYRQVIQAILIHKEIEIIEIPFDEQKGVVTTAILNQTLASHPKCSILVVAQPNFFGQLEEVNALTDWGHEHSALVIGLVNPCAMALLKPPGLWGQKGVDIACGEGQPLGIPLASGGPYFGFLCSRLSYVRQLPGRLVGRTVDSAGNEGFTLTLQAREQHIRREKATSNICTNQGLLVTAATIYMSLLGPKGLQQVAKCCYQRTKFLVKTLQGAGFDVLFGKNHFHEIVIQLPLAAQSVVIAMAQKGIAAGFAISPYYPTLKNALLVCVTETKTEDDILQYVKLLKEIMTNHPT